MGEALGLFRAYYLVSLACIGSFLFAYDTGIVGGILTLPSFQQSFRYSSHRATSVNSNCVSVLQAGAFFGCFFILPITSHFGRRISLQTASLIFCIGAILQTIDSHSLALFYVGRVIGGLGVGAITSVIPVFSAEMAPKELRGRLGSFFQFFFAMGVCVSYWVDYGVTSDLPSSSRQWQIPVGLQLVPGALVGLGQFLVPESCRWLAKKGRTEAALKSLTWVRGGVETDQVRVEFQEILTGLKEEEKATQGVTWKEVFLPGVRKRMAIAIAIQICGQLSGNTSLAYYAPQIFKSVGAGNSSNLVTGFFGVVKVVSVFFFQLLLVESVGRRWSFIGGALAMGSFMLIIGLIVANFPPNPKATHPTSPGIAAILMVYCEAASYNLSWGPLSWLYIGEIFPTRVREFGNVLGAATQWLFNFVFSQATPHMIDNIGWKTFMVFFAFNYANAIFAFLCLKETKGRSLEEMEQIFGSTATAFDNEQVREEVSAKRIERNEIIDDGPGSDRKSVESGNNIQTV